MYIFKFDFEHDCYLSVGRPNNIHEYPSLSRDTWFWDGHESSFTWAPLELGDFDKILLSMTFGFAFWE